MYSNNNDNFKCLYKKSLETHWRAPRNFATNYIIDAYTIYARFIDKLNIDFNTIMPYNSWAEVVQSQVESY